MEPHADLETGSKVLPGRITGEGGGLVAYGNTGGVTAMLDEVFLKGWRAIPIAIPIAIAILVALADDTRPFLIEINQRLCHILTFSRIAAKQIRVTAALQD